MAAHRGAPPLFNHSAEVEMWPPGFVYDLDVALLSAPPPNRTLSYADVAANHHHGLCWTALPLGNTLRAMYPSSNKEGPVPRL